MSRQSNRVCVTLLALCVASCASDTVPQTKVLGTSLLFDLFERSEWSEPVHLDAPVNSPFRELGGSFSRDGLSLYFGSDRPGGQGAFDIWVSRRTCRECPWGEPANLGPNINSPTGDGVAAFSPDGRMMYFSGGHRPGGMGGEDIWVSRRSDPNDDLGWGPPVNLGATVNTAADERGPHLFFRAVGDGDADLLFARAGSGFFQVRITRDGEVVGAPVPIAELNDPAGAGATEVHFQGREEFVFQAVRAGGLGGADLWISSRRNYLEAWTTPRNLGPTINTSGGELQPGLSWDGRTLVFAASASARPSLGFQDLWISTRNAP